MVKRSCKQQTVPVFHSDRKGGLSRAGSPEKTANKTYTENGAVAHRTSGKDCLDLFAAIGALRRADDQNICSRFLKAYAENSDLAMKILFYA
ncbi:hypothetical protein LEA_08751, partial [human gut metagenome]